MIQRVFFNHTVAAMFIHAFPPDAHRGLVDRLAENGIDVRRPLLPAYEYPVWRRCLEVQRLAVFPDHQLDDASRKQGERYVESYFERTALGGPLKLLLRAIGPRRTLQRLTLNFRSANSFSEVSMQQTAPTQASLSVNDVFSASPAYIVGMLEKGLELVGTRGSVKATRHVGDAADFVVTWS